MPMPFHGKTGPIDEFSSKNVQTIDVLIFW